jgi:hypothetical protein
MNSFSVCWRRFIAQHCIRRERSSGNRSALCVCWYGCSWSLWSTSRILQHRVSFSKAVITASAIKITLFTVRERPAFTVLHFLPHGEAAPAICIWMTSTSISAYSGVAVTARLLMVQEVKITWHCLRLCVPGPFVHMWRVSWVHPTTRYEVCYSVWWWCIPGKLFRLAFYQGMEILWENFVPLCLQRVQGSSWGTCMLAQLFKPVRQFLHRSCHHQQRRSYKTVCLGFAI